MPTPRHFRQHRISGKSRPPRGSCKERSRSGFRIEALERRDLLTVVPDGGEFQVNTYTHIDQEEVSIAMDADGDLVAVWASELQDGRSAGIYGQRFDRDGVPQGSEFAVDLQVSGAQRNPTVAMDADGDFVVVWRDSVATIYGQRFSRDGVPLGTEFRVNVLSTQLELNPNVAMASNGDFVVAWEGKELTGDNRDIFARTYRASGVPRDAGEFRVNSSTQGHQAGGFVAMDGVGNFVVTWNTAESNGDQNVLAQRFTAAGLPAGNEFQVNSLQQGHQVGGKISMSPAGNFVIAWEGKDPTSDRIKIYARRYDAAGNSIGSEIPVSHVLIGSHTKPAVALDAEGNFVITWQANGITPGGQNYEIYARRFTHLGQPDGDPFLVPSYTAGTQWKPVIAMDDDGSFVISWESEHQDGSRFGVFAKQFEGHNDFVWGDLDGDQDVDGADFVIWQTHYPTASGASVSTGDADGDGDVDGADFVIWQVNFPTVAPASGTAQQFIAPPPPNPLLSGNGFGAAPENGAELPVVPIISKQSAGSESTESNSHHGGLATRPALAATTTRPIPLASTTANRLAHRVVQDFVPQPDTVAQLSPAAVDHWVERAPMYRSRSLAGWMFAHDKSGDDELLLPRVHE